MLSWPWKLGQGQTYANPILPSEGVKQHTKFDDTSFILSQVIIQKPTSIKNKLTTPVTLKIRGLPAYKVAKQHAKFDTLSFIFH